jgi:tetraacyldisaccharide 4'-kinase
MPKWLSYLLLPFSWIYGAVVMLRTYLYSSKIYTRSKFDFPIICVGNITAGGTGKTPHIEYLIQLLQPNYQLAVLSRGYKRKTTGYLFSSAISTPNDIGDEPYQIKQKYPEVALAVGENRVLSVPALLSDASQTQAILMDDGFQHLSIEAGYNIVLCDYNRPYYNDFLLPAGLLREPISGANRAQIIIVTKCPPDLTNEEQQQIIHKLKPASHQQVFFSCIEYKAYRPLTQAAHEMAFLPQQASFNKIVAMAGIAKSELFVREVQSHFNNVVPLIFNDHVNYDGEKINLMRHHTNQPNSAIVTTEKDAVKLMDEDLIQHINHIPMWYLPIGVKVLNNEEEKLKQVLINYIEMEMANAISE